jgi:hypothetical protein
MLFLNSQFAQKALTSYDVLWGEEPREEPSIQLLQPDYQTALRFYDYIRLHAGEKIDINALIAIGINVDAVFELFMLIYLKQPNTIQMFQNEDITYLVYNGMG